MDINVANGSVYGLVAGLTSGASLTSNLPAAAIAAASCMVCVALATILSSRREL